MAKILDLLNISKDEPKRSWFDRSHINRFSMSPGVIYPIFCEEIIPNSFVKLNFKDLVKSDPLLGSLYGSFRMSYQAFFVPSRLYNYALDSNKYAPLNSSTGQPFDDSFPTFSPYQYMENYSYPTTIKAPRGGLLDMLGYFPADIMVTLPEDMRLNAIPLIAYYDICRSYYVNNQNSNLPILLSQRVGSLGIEGDTETINDTYANWQYVSNDVSLSALSETINSIYLGQDNFIDILSSFTNFTPLLSSYEFEEAGIHINGNTSQEFIAYVPKIANHRIASPHNGYCVRPYDDTYFSVALNENYVDVSNSVSVNIVDGKLYTNQLYRVNALQQFVNNNVFFSGNTYGDWLKAHFGIKSNTKLRIPEFLGSYSHNIYFEDIYATASSDGNADNNRVGDRSSVTSTSANTYGKNNFVEFTAQEHGYIMIMCSLVPIPTFSQGQPKMLLKTSLSDCYSPEFDAVGFQDIFKSEAYLGMDLSNSIVGTGVNNINFQPPIFENVSIGKQPAWMEYMTSYDRSHGLLASDERSYWTLNRNFASVENVSIDASVYFDGGVSAQILPFNITFDNNDLYIKPELFNHMFYNQNPGVDHFYNQVAFDFQVKQPMSKQILPRL